MCTGSCAVGAVRPISPIKETIERIVSSQGHAAVRDGVSCSEHLPVAPQLALLRELRGRGAPQNPKETVAAPRENRGGWSGEGQALFAPCITFIMPAEWIGDFSEQ